MSLCKTSSPWGAATFDPREIIWTILTEVKQMNLYTKYDRSVPSALDKKDFKYFFYSIIVLKNGKWMMPIDDDQLQQLPGRLQLMWANNMGRKQLKDHDPTALSWLTQNIYYL